MSLESPDAAVEVVVVEGEDATTLIDSQVSQALTPVLVGTSCWSLLLEPDGSFGDWVRIAREDEGRWAVLGAPSRTSAIAERLGRFKLREKVSIAPEWRQVLLIADREGVEGVELPVLWSEAGEAEVLVGREVAPGDPAMAAALERRRVAMGRLGPADLRPGDNPFAIGADRLAASVSFTKGCYTGQELVARMDARSASAPRRLVVATGTAAAALGARLVLDGKEVGEVRSNSGGSMSICMVARSVVLPTSGEVTIDGAPVSLREATGSR